jgi:hypothetical protein
MQWVLVYPPEQRERGGRTIFAEIFPGVVSRAEDGGPSPVPNTSVEPAALVIERPGEGLIIEPEKGGPLDGVEPGPHRSLKEVNAAVREYTGEMCQTLSSAPG